MDKLLISFKSHIHSYSKAALPQGLHYYANYDKLFLCSLVLLLLFT